MRGTVQPMCGMVLLVCWGLARCAKILRTVMPAREVMMPSASAETVRL